MAALSSSINFLYITSSIAPTFADASSNTGYKNFRYVSSLKNTIDWYRPNSEYYNSTNISSSIANNGGLIINIPNLFFGQSIKRGSTELSFYYDGNLIGKLQDIKCNGELVQTLPSGSNGSGSTAGVVLYNEGLILVTGSWSLDNLNKDFYIYESHSSSDSSELDYPRWIHWGKSYINALNSSSFGFDFEGSNYTPSITMFAHADKNELNTSNNPTYIENSNQVLVIQSSSNTYIENDTLSIKNTVYEPYTNYTGSFEKQVFISKIGIYDEERNLIAIVKLAKPIKKTSERDLTFKIKLDL
jgi:hypothetical protein